MYDNQHQHQSLRSNSGFRSTENNQHIHHLKMASFKDPEDEKNVFLALVDQLPKPPVPRACTNSTYSGTPANVPTTYISPYSSHAPAVNPFTTNTTNTENPDLADLLERIDDLTEKNGELAREVTRIKNLNSGLVRQHKLDDENIDQLNQYADQVETECRELTRTNRELQLDLVNTRVVRDKLQADLANTRIERDSALVANEGHLNIKRLHGELMNTSKELEEANKRIKNYELWFIGQSHGPTIMGPITPPRHKGDVAFAVPSTPEKSILHLNGSKVRSVEMELKRKVDLYNLEHGTNHQANKYQQNPAKTAWTDKHGVYCEVMDGLPFAAPEHRAMVDINEFNKLEAAQCGPEVYKMYGSDAGINDDNDNNDGIDDDDDDYGPPPTPSPKFRPANTTTKKKVVAKKVVEMKNVVPKKQAARKKTTNGSVAKQKPIAIYDSDDNNTIIVESEDEEPRLPSRRRGATAQAQNAMEDEEETEDEDVHNGDYQRYAAFSQNWRFDCICKTKDQAAIKAADVECTKCRAWSHQMVSRTFRLTQCYNS